MVLSLLSMSLIRPARHVAGGAAGDPALSLFDLCDGAAASRILYRALGHGLGIGHGDLRVDPAPGHGGGGLAWTVVFTISPISAVYYPVSILPGWLQHVYGCCRRPTCSKECGRSCSGNLCVDYLLTAVALDLVYVS
jgi:ABC-2 type transport system permease protein